MDTWYYKELGSSTSASDSCRQILQTFRQMPEADRPPSLCVFTYCDLAAGSVTVYFPPSAKNLAELMEALPCIKPRPDKGLGMLVGDPACWHRYFPGFRDASGS